MSGMWYEEFEPGMIIKHPIRRTVTEMDNILITTLTMNTQPLHLDAAFSAETFYGQRLVNSIFTLGVTVGVTVSDTTLGTTLGNLGFDELRFPNPVFHGDTLHAETEVLARRVSNSRPTAGLVTFRHRGYNQRDEIVCDCKRVGLMMRRPEPGAADAADGTPTDRDEG